MKNNDKGGMNMKTKNLVGALGLVGALALGGCDEKNNIHKTHPAYIVNGVGYWVNADLIMGEKRYVRLENAQHEYIRAEDCDNNGAFDNIEIRASKDSPIRELATLDGLEAAYRYVLENTSSN